MEYKEFGKGQAETIILLHGGGLSWWNYRGEAMLLQSDFHVVLPLLDGHAGSGRPFTSIEDNAAEIIDFIGGHLGGSVLLIGGLSLGGQILLEILSRRGDICRYAMAESAAVVPSGVTGALIGPALDCTYGLIKNRAFARLQFASLHMAPELFDEYYRDTCRIGKDDMAAFIKASAAYSLNRGISRTAAEVHVFAGEKEDRRILRSADAVCEAVPGCRKTILPDLRHGEFSVSYPERYAGILKEIIGK